MAAEPSYESLEPSASQIRLLRLLPPSATSTDVPSTPWYRCIGLECTFETVPLSDAPAYEALSYAWGDDPPSVPPLLNEREVSIRPNLAYALAALRKSKPRTTGIDALFEQNEWWFGLDDLARNGTHWPLVPSIWRRDSAKTIRIRHFHHRRLNRVFITNTISDEWVRKQTEADSGGDILASRSSAAQEQVVPEQLSWSPGDDDREGIGGDASLVLNTAARSPDWSWISKKEPLPEAPPTPSTRLQEQLGHWVKTRAKFKRHKQEQKRLPKMLEDLQNAEPFLTQKRRELKELKALESQQKRALKDLILLEQEQQRRLSEPRQRLLQDFEDSRQQLLLQGKTIIADATLPGAWGYKQYHERHWIKHQLHDLRRIHAGREEQWTNTQSLHREEDPILTEKEVQVLAEVKGCKRALLQQRILLREAELKRWEIEAVLRQYAKWTELWREMKEGEMMEWLESILPGDRTEIALGFSNIGLISLERVCTLPYWKRLWIVQEVLLAKEEVLCFGDDVKTAENWDLFTGGRRSLDRLPELWKLSPAIQTAINKIRHSFPFQLDRLRRDHGQQWQLHSLIDMTENSLCRDPLDKIYGLLGLAGDFQTEDFGISYKKSVQEVYQDAIRWYYVKHGEDEGSPSLARFSQMLQTSRRGHSDQQISGGRLAPLPVDETCPSRERGLTLTKGMLAGPIIYTGPLAEDRDWAEVRQRDRISSLLQYLNEGGFQGLKFAIEEQLEKDRLGENSQNLMEQIVRPFTCHLMQRHSKNLTAPLETSIKNASRVPLDIQEASFGCTSDDATFNIRWYGQTDGELGISATDFSRIFDNTWKQVALDLMGIVELEVSTALGAIDVVSEAPLSKGQ
ncbi:hypothetical protein B0H63DRAFT_557260 [Podospora didyma]|uniref:Heterokaryon incompatibility domain-containing protein n=1 Tax=Podospora didyma TaxID=330526 RepID=A0AAE0U492_9PEZI|nr:hypothetical protein B0H63DRAFT_557260 [Podospora didyma]